VLGAVHLGAVGGHGEHRVVGPQPQVLREPEPLIPGPVAQPAAVVDPPVAPVVEPAIPVVLASAGPARETEPITLRELPELSLRPSAVAPSAPLPAETPEAAEARVSFKELAAALLGGTNPAPATPIVAAPIAAEEPAMAPLVLDTPRIIEPVSEPVIAPAPMAAAVEPQSEEAVEPAPLAGLTVEALVAGAAAAAPASPSQAVADTAKQLLTALPQEFAGLNFPNDGVLTRQWMEFLNQMSTTK